MRVYSGGETALAESSYICVGVKRALRWLKAEIVGVADLE